MAKMVSFRPNHKIFSGFVARSGKKLKKKKVYRNSKKISNLTKIIGRGAISTKVLFQPTLMYKQSFSLVRFSPIPCNLFVIMKIIEKLFLLEFANFPQKLLTTLKCILGN
jgi:hypothetical protein